MAIISGPTKTQTLLLELARCEAALRAYHTRATKGDNHITKEHATAYRATLDLHRKLVEWRKADVPFQGEK